MHLLRSTALSIILALSLSLTLTTGTPNLHIEDSTELEAHEDSPNSYSLDYAQEGPVPIPEPDHGIDNETFYTLWSGDYDTPPDADAPEDPESLNGSALVALARSADIPFDTPPEAVGVWNRGEHEDFDASNASESLYPANANTVDGEYVRDAYVDILTIEDSTRAIEGATQTLYVPPSGNVRGIIDYRIQLPPDIHTNTTERIYRLRRHEIESTRLLVDGDPTNQVGDTHRPTLLYSGLSRGASQSIELVSRISANVEIIDRECMLTIGNGSCVVWESSVQVDSETVTVRDQLEVQQFSPRVSGERATFPDGTRGLMLDFDQPWAAYRIPDGVIQNRMRFFSMGDPTWTRLTRATASESEHVSSPTRPLHVFAYPSGNPVSSSKQWHGIEVDAIDGPARSPPILPEYVNLDVPNQSYTQAERIIVRVDESSGSTSFGELSGITGGPNQTIPSSSFPEISIQETALNVRVLDQTSEETTLEVSLTVNETGDPIPSDAGVLLVGGVEVEISASGSTEVGIPRSSGVVTARFEPVLWWEAERAYASSEDQVYAGGTDLDLPGVLFALVVPVGLFLVSVFLVDRFTVWRVWPPWRGL